MEGVEKVDLNLSVCVCMCDIRTYGYTCTTYIIVLSIISCIPTDFNAIHIAPHHIASVCHYNKVTVFIFKN